MGFFDDDEANYTIVNGRAYTEDSVLVHNLFLFNIPRNTTREQTLEYFKKFGEVENVRLINDRKRKNAHTANKIGFVNFRDPLVAAKVLQYANHFINKKRIRARACDSWHQPGATASEETTYENNVADESLQDALILNLNDDCLEIIFKNLPTIDQINLARSCRRLRDVFIMNSKLEYKVFHLSELENLTLWQTRQFLEMAGPQIETLDGTVPYKQTNRIIEFLGLFCTNVKNLSIHSTILKPPTLRKLLKKMTAITDLELNDVELCDRCVSILKSLPKLKVLSLENNYQISGKHIKDLTNIESLSLNGCPQLKTADINEIVTHLNKLETVKICSNCPQIQRIAQLPKLKHLLLFAEDPSHTLQPTLFEELAKHQSNQLETFHVDSFNCMDVTKATHIAQLKKLKKLMCPHNETLNDSCLEKLALLPDLEMISLKKCKSFTDKGLLDLIKSCHKLHTLNIVSCTQIKDTFPKEVLDMLKTQRAQRDQKKPLTISAFRSGINQFAVSTPVFESASDLVQFKFAYQSDGNDLEEMFYSSDFYGDTDDDDDDFFFGGMDDDEDDYYMYYSDPDEVDLDLDFDILRHALFGRHGDDINDINF